MLGDFAPLGQLVLAFLELRFLDVGNGFFRTKFHGLLVVRRTQELSELLDLLKLSKFIGYFLYLVKNFNYYELPIVLQQST